MTTALVLALLAGGAAAGGSPRCLGAAARDARHPCSNPSLRLTARPGRLLALVTPNEPCDVTATVGAHRLSAGQLKVCEFGVPRRQASRTVALVGDSHAMSWRAAVTATADRLGWHGVNLTRSHCPFSFARRALDPLDMVGCRRFNRRVLRYLRRHREVSVVFVAHQSGGSPFTPSAGRTPFQTEAHGFASAWRALPASVSQVLAIRDNPHLDQSPHACIRKALTVPTPPGRACASARSVVLRPDAFESAKRLLPSRRYQMLDLTHYFCGATACRPVIGGVRVYKDTEHLTRVWARTLGPYLARAVRSRLSRRPG